MNDECDVVLWSNEPACSWKFLGTYFWRASVIKRRPAVRPSVCLKVVQCLRECNRVKEIMKWLICVVGVCLLLSPSIVVSLWSSCSFAWWWPHIFTHVLRACLFLYVSITCLLQYIYCMPWGLTKFTVRTVGDTYPCVRSRITRHYNMLEDSRCISSLTCGSWGLWDDKAVSHTPTKSLDYVVLGYNAYDRIPIDPKL